MNTSKCTKCYEEFDSNLLSAHEQEVHTPEGHRALQLYSATWATEGADLLDIQRHPGRRGHSHHHAKTLVCGERLSLEMCNSGQSPDVRDGGTWAMMNGDTGPRVACKQVLRLVDYQARMGTIEVFYLNAKWGTEVWARENVPKKPVYPCTWAEVVNWGENTPDERNEMMVFYARKWDEEGSSKLMGK